MKPYSARSWLRASAAAITVLCAGAEGARAEPTFTLWKEMHAGANLPSVAAAVETCREKLSLELCQKLEDGLVTFLYSTGQNGWSQPICELTSAPDGLRYSWLSGRNGRLYPWQQKALGADTSVVECSLAPGIVVHWYNQGDGVCNNLGLIYAPPPANIEEQSSLRWECWYEDQTQAPSSTTYSYTPSITLEDCCCGGYTNFQSVFSVIEGAQIDTPSQLFCGWR